MFGCICMAESLRYSPETITTLLIGSTTIQNKKFKRNLKKTAFLLDHAYVFLIYKVIFVNICLPGPSPLSKFFQAVKQEVKSFSCIWKGKVAESRLTLCDQWAPLSMEFSKQDFWSGYLFLSPENLPNSGIKLKSPALQAESLLFEPPGKPKNTGVGSRFLLQRVFPTPGSNRGLLHCRWILYQLSYQGSLGASILSAYTSINVICYMLFLYWWLYYYIITFVFCYRLCLKVYFVRYEYCYPSFPVVSKFVWNTFFYSFTFIMSVSLALKVSFL